MAGDSIGARNVAEQVSVSMADSATNAKNVVEQASVSMVDGDTNARNVVDGVSVSMAGSGINANKGVEGQASVRMIVFAASAGNAEGIHLPSWRTESERNVERQLSVRW